MSNLRVNENRGYTLVEVMVVVVLMGLTSLAVIGIMSALSTYLSESHSRMTASTFGMELRNHLDKMKSDGIGYCMEHPTSGGFYSKSLGRMVNDLGSSQIKQIVDKAQFEDKAGDKSLRIPIDAKVLFTGESVYGGTASAKSADYLTLMSSELHSFIIRKRILSYQVAVPRIIQKNSDSKVGYIYLVSAVLENQFYKGEIPKVAANRKQDRIVSSKINVNFVIRYIGSNSMPYRVVDCGTGSLSRTTAFVESCKSLGADFEYVVDHPTGANPKGQCYVPQYGLMSSFGVADGTKPGVITSYVPIRAFLCEGLFDGKSLNMPFCTGSF